MTADGSRVGSWIRRVVDGVRWIAESEQLPGGAADATSSPRRSGGDASGGSLAGWASWLAEGERLPEAGTAPDRGRAGPGDRAGSSWIRWLMAAESLPPAPDGASTSGDRGGFIAWLSAGEPLPDPEDGSRKQEGRRGN